MRLSDFVIEWLVSKNINDIFTVSGGGSIALCDAIANSNSMNYYCCHHEQAAAFAAEGYSRESSDIGAALFTTGPGGTNAITGVSCAWIDSVPIIFISGQVFSNQTIVNTKLRQLGVQEINIVDLVKPNTKYAVVLKKPSDIKYELEKAYYYATSNRPGPVWIDIPADFQAKQVNPNKLRSYHIRPKKSDKLYLNDKILLLKEKLSNSKRPIILAGHGVRLSKAQNELIKFAENFNIPISTTWNASDIIESNHNLFVGRPGAFAERGINFIIQNSDLILSIGTRLPFMVTSYNSKDFGRNAFKIMVDIDINETLKDSFDIDLPIKSDALIFLKTLNNNNEIKCNPEKSWLNFCKSLRNKYPIVDKIKRKKSKYINSYVFIEQLSKVASNKVSIITDMGLSFVGTHQAYKIKKSQKLFTNSGHAPMGWGLPAAFGASVFNKERQIICITGDGGIMMNIQELATIMHHKPNIKIFLYNNKGYLTIKQTQQLGFNGRLMGSEDKDLSFPKFDLIAKAHGIPYISLDGFSNLSKAINNFLNIKGPAICELILDPEQPQVPKAINQKDKDGNTIVSKFEELYPFLSQDEIRENLL